MYALCTDESIELHASFVAGKKFYCCLLTDGVVQHRGAETWLSTSLNGITAFS